MAHNVQFRLAFGNGGSVPGYETGSQVPRAHRFSVTILTILLP